MRMRSPRILPNPFRVLKDLRDGRAIRIPPRAPYTEPSGIASVQRILASLVSEGLAQVDDDGVLSLDPKVPRLFRALGVSLSRLQDYNHDAVICHPRFQESRRTGILPGVFVVMPFDKELRSIYDDHIKAAVESEGLTCMRGDDLFGSESIIREIWTFICNAKVIIADCTGRNPNVFYEIGIAHTVGVPVILVTQSVDDVPFDLRNERVVVYDHTPAGLAALEHAIKEALAFERSGV